MSIRDDSDAIEMSEAPNLISDVEPVPEAELSKNTSIHDLLHLYERVVRTQPGTHDAEIFEKVREWTFSDFSMPAHVFAGISKADLRAWQTRNRINLSAGQIRPDPIDLQRGYAWGHMRMAAHVNHLYSDRPPPSKQEIDLHFSSRER